MAVKLFWSLTSLKKIRSKLEIAEAKLTERDAEVASLNDEMSIYKQESREIAAKLQIELDNVKMQKSLARKGADEEREILSKKNLELKSMLEAAERDVASFKTELSNVNKSKWQFTNF